MMKGMHFCVIVGVLLALPCALGSASAHTRGLSAVESKLFALRQEVSDIHSNIIRDHGKSSETVAHLLESLKQAEDGARDAAGGLHRPPTPSVGTHARFHIVHQIIGSILQVIGIYGLLVCLGSISYYCLAGLFISGSLFAAFLSSIPALFTSALFFPPLLIFIELLFGMSYFMNILSFNGFKAAIDLFGMMLVHPVHLEYMGLVTLLVGALNLFIRHTAKDMQIFI